MSQQKALRVHVKACSKVLTERDEHCLTKMVVQ